MRANISQNIAAILNNESSIDQKKHFQLYFYKKMFFAKFS